MFVSITLPADGFRETEEIDNVKVYRLGKTLSEDGKTYTCEECSVRDGEYDEEEIQAAYDEHVKTKTARRLAQAKREKTAEIDAYDTSPAVNGFSLNGATVWLDKSTRVGLMNSTNITKAMGQPTTTLWLGESKMEVPCDTAIRLLSALEMYALECFNVTAAHKKAVSELTDIAEVLTYDYTAGYPAQLKMEV